MRNEYPNMQLYCNNTIARIIFSYDNTHRPQWFNIAHMFELQLYIDLPNLAEYSVMKLKDTRIIIVLHIEEWLISQGMSSVEDDLTLFELVWS